MDLFKQYLCRILRFFGKKVELDEPEIFNFHDEHEDCNDSDYDYCNDKDYKDYKKYMK
jgi:hypothetical protein